jgi:hypothetical protein
MRLGKVERRKPAAGLKGEDLVVSERVDISREKSVQPLKWFPISVVLLLLAFWRVTYSHYGACDGYNGVLYVAQGDVEGAAGTIFFLFVMNQLIYADKHNLLPWVHLNNISHYVFDPQEHNSQPPRSFLMLQGVNVSWASYEDPISQEQITFPGKPIQVQSPLTAQLVTVSGNGVWNSYFDPASDFSPDDVSCRSKPLIRLTHKQIIPALHIFSPWSVRAWRYGGLPPSLRQDNLSYHDWFAPMRKHGHEMVKKYFHIQPQLRQMANVANPASKCLALHIRHSDKANRRRRIPVKKFLPFVEAYVQEHRTITFTPTVYLATDSHKVVQEIETTWPQEIVSRMRWQSEVVRSNNKTPVFTLSSHHVTNTQVLVDIVAMSKCQHLLHGLSAVSEAVHYFNPTLHNQSVNLELPKHSSVAEFQETVQHVLIRSKK